MKAIHNGCGLLHIGTWDAFDSSKIQKWKQFTTRAGFELYAKEMLLIVQRYKNESNSQQQFYYKDLPCRCFW